MASVGLAARAQHQRAARAPRAALVVALTLAGLAAAGTSVALALASDHVAEPGLQAALMDWITLPYIVGGLIAWWRRPESRFGPLMVAAGFAIFLSTLAWANHALPFTVGQAFDLLPAVLFLHVFLAFPDGRLRRGFERALLAAGYVIAFGLELVGMALGGFGPDNLLAVTAEPELAGVLLQVQLIALSALALAGIAVLAARRRSATRPPRRAVGLMIDAFALALVMIAVLLRPRRIRRAGLRDRPARHVLRHRARADRLPDRAAERAAGALGRRRPRRRAATASRRRAPCATRSPARCTTRR